MKLIDNVTSSIPIEQGSQNLKPAEPTNGARFINKVVPILGYCEELTETYNRQKY